MKPELFTKPFVRELESMGFNVPCIQAELSLLPRHGSAKQKLREWTGLSNDSIDAGLVRKDRDIDAPKLYAVLTKELTRWTIAHTGQDLPRITVKQLTRQTHMSPEHVVSVLEQYPFVCTIDGIAYTSRVRKPVFPDSRLRLSDSNRYGVSASRVSRDGRFQSKKPGRNTVQKSGLQGKRVNASIRKMSWENTNVSFTPVGFDETSVSYGVMKELEGTPGTQKNDALEVLYASDRASELLEVYTWLSEIGYGKHWLYKQRGTQFAETLSKLSQGEQVDFLIWNCIGFSWRENAYGYMPSCCITNNLDAAITVYFQDSIRLLATVLSEIGQANFIILVPGNEGLDRSGVWTYEQTESERRVILEETVRGLQRTFQANTEQNIEVMQWNEYLSSRGARYEADSYSRLGEMRLRSSGSFNRIIKEAVKSGRGYFAQNGITNIRSDILRDREIAYYGIYAGEGVAFEELQNAGRNIVSVNYEEFRVPQMEYLGANGNLTILTPITQQEMLSYYRWEARQINRRNP